MDFSIKGRAKLNREKLRVVSVWRIFLSHFSFAPEIVHMLAFNTLRSSLGKIFYNCKKKTVLQRKSAIGYFQTRKQNVQWISAAKTQHPTLYAYKSPLRNTPYNLDLQTYTITSHLIKTPNKPSTVKQSSVKTVPLSWIGSGRHYRKWLVVWSWPMVLQRCGWSLPSEQDPSGHRKEGKEKGQVKLNSTAHFPAPIRQTRSSIMLMERSMWQDSGGRRSAIWWKRHLWDHVWTAHL